MIELFPYQKDTVELLKSGSILCGGVGSGKSLTSIGYYFFKECGGIDSSGHALKRPKDLYIITTALKRDKLEWDSECRHFLISREREASISGVKLVVDSWNNIDKYTEVTNAFFIFDEQRLVGSGLWVKSFLKIVKKNNWILLSATPGDTWMDYVPVFIANGFYKTRAEFLRSHVVYNSFVSFPKVDRYVNTSILTRHKKNILVYMDYEKSTVQHHYTIPVEYNKERYDIAFKKRWNPYTNLPIANASELCSVLRKITNSDESRIVAVTDIILKSKKVIIFYNFDYELAMLRLLCDNIKFPYSEWNGHKHEPLLKTSEWVYLVQYTAGSEGWNCIDTDTILFYSQNYSFKIMHQAAGRIDRLNTPFIDLHYYHLKSVSKIDLAIAEALKNKKTFNENNFVSF